MEQIITKEYFDKAEKIAEKLYIIGDSKSKTNSRITIVGSRKPSLYGRNVVEKIVSGASDYPITIVSGLALGIDSLAHEMALKYGVHTIAVPGSGLSDSVLYPRTNISLAKRIVESGGALISPWENQSAAIWTFPSRNGVMAAISDFVLIIEAEEDSGTMITAREAIKRKINVGAVPGNIDNIYSSGPNYLLKNGAHCVTSINDILKSLNINVQNNILNRKTNHPILRHLNNPIHRDALSNLTNLCASEMSIELTMLEISGEIIIDSNGYIRLR